MAKQTTQSPFLKRALILPLFIGLFGLAALWPLFEASLRLQAGEEVLFGSVPSDFERIRNELVVLTGVDETVGSAAADHFIGHFTEQASDELKRSSAQSEDEPESAPEAEFAHQADLDEAFAEETASAVDDPLVLAVEGLVDTFVTDLRELHQVLEQSGEALSEQESAEEAGEVTAQEIAESDNEESEGTAEEPINAFVILLNKNITELAAAQDRPTRVTLTSAFLAQVKVVLDPIRQQKAEEFAEYGEAEEVPVSDQMNEAITALWKPPTTLSYLVFLGLFSILSLLNLALSCGDVSKRWKRLLRSHHFAHLGLATIAMAGFSAIPLITAIHFGASNGDGWAMALIADTFYYLWPLWLVWALLLASHGYLSRAVVAQRIDPTFEGTAAGDRLLTALRGGGADSEYSSATKRSVVLHCIAIIGPILLAMIPGCWGTDSYKLPSGSGEPAAAVMVQVVEEKQEKEELVLAEDSPIIFERATIDDSDAMKQLVQESRQTYEASASGAAGAMGVGGGQEGGFLGEGGPIRFMRVRHRSAGWDDGMNAKTGNADANFLRWIARAASLETETNGEAMTIEQIYNRFPQGERPPFIYLTGRSLQFSQAERDALRKLCLEGTLLFADSESPRFTRDFQSEMRRVFSDRKLLLINDEDPIMRIPNVFPNGLQSNQWHGANQAMGIRHKRQLVVLFHPGDCNDMWKDGASSIDRDIRNTALWIGQNIIYYSFKRYTERYKGGRGQ